MTIQSSAKTWFLLILLLLVSTDLAVLLDIPVLRQGLGFLFFTVVPGLLILEIMKVEGLGRAERIVFAVALSVAFLMTCGLIINWAYFELGYETPLSKTSLTLSLSAVVAVLAIVAYIRTKSSFLDGLRGKDSETIDILSPGVLLIALIPILGILGGLVVRFYESSLLSVLATVVIAGAAVLVILNRVIPRRLFPLALFAIALALLLNRTLTSAYLYDIDIHYEYYFHKLVEQAAHWDASGVSDPLNSMLSTTLLPTIYSALMKTDAIWIFKICFIAIFALAPVGLY
jgi:uncharacterized membrane protein